MNAEKSTPPSIEQIVADKIAEHGGSIRNNAALGALVKVIPGVGDGLYHALTAGDEAIRNEKAQLQLELLCGLVEKIDRSITEMLEEAQGRGLGFVEIGGEINVRGEHAENVTGLNIAAGRSATIKPGTVINVQGAYSTNITGVKI